MRYVVRAFGLLAAALALQPGPRVSKRLRYHFTLTLRAATSTAHSIYPHPPGCPQTRLREVDLVPRARQPHG